MWISSPSFTKEEIKAHRGNITCSKQKMLLRGRRIDTKPSQLTAKLYFFHNDTQSSIKNQAESGFYGIRKAKGSR